jgi:hypothetical protein
VVCQQKKPEMCNAEKSAQLMGLQDFWCRGQGVAVAGADAAVGGWLTHIFMHVC